MYEVTENQFLSLLNICALEVLRLYFQLQFDLLFILKSGAQDAMIWFSVSAALSLSGAETPLAL